MVELKLLFIILYLTCSCSTDDISKSSKFSQLCDDYWKWRISDMPQFATLVGIHDYDEYLDDMSEEAYFARFEKCHNFLRRANDLQSSLTASADIVNIKVLKYELQLFIGNFDLKGFYLPMNFMNGPQRYHKNEFKWMSRNTYKDYTTMLNRMRKLPQQLDQIINLFKAGVRNNITLHKISMKNFNNTVGKFSKENPKESPFYTFFHDGFPDNFTKEQITELQTEAQEIISKQVSPAYEKLRKYLIEEYVPRKSIAVTTIKKGKEFYNNLIWFQTSTNFSAEKIQEIGFREVKKIEMEMKKIAIAMGFENSTLQEFSNMIRDDPTNYYNSSDDLLAEFERIVHGLVPSRLPQIFKSIPKSKLKVEAVMNSDGIFAYYSSGNFDRTRSGIFTFNAYDPRTQPKYNMLTLSLHEANPGHHFQVSHIIESPDFPYFRRFRDTRNTGVSPSRFPHYASYIEGWALYAETLGFDMKLFENLLDRYGHYSMKIFRACRLVVDTGIHAFEWTREQAVDYMFNHTASTRAALENEVDRYITWPGQALSYMLGELSIRQLRKEAEERLGDIFDIKDFHDVILNSFGSMDIVQEEVHKWINKTLDVHTLYDDYWNWRITDMPQFATFVGIHENDDILDDLSNEAYLSRYEKCKYFLRRAEMIEKVLAQEAEKNNLQVLKHELKLYIENYSLKGFYLPLNYLEGPHKYADRQFKWMRLNTYEDYEVMIRRMEKLPFQLKQIIDLMKRGAENNITYHEISMKRMNELLGKFVIEDPKKSPFFSFFSGGFPANFSEKQIIDLQLKALQVIKFKVSPAYDELRNYILNDYVPRKQIAVTSINNGENFYNRLIWFHTSTNLSAEEIHNIGLKEVVRIEKEMQKIAEELGHSNLSAQEFSNLIRDNPENYYSNSEDLMKEFNRLVNDVIQPKLSTIFNKIPKSELQIKASMSLSGVKAYYNSASLFGSRPGIFWVNAYDSRTQPKYDMLTLSLHEANPGHHFQSSHFISSKNVPYFRIVNDGRTYGISPSQFPFYTDFGEGWALYAESLGFDMNLFADPLDRYGHYSMKIFRACRLVVDTGLHVFGWTREHAVEYMFNHTASTRAELENEIDRYITWPGQALSYMLGEISIRQLRKESEERLGDLFNIKDFHDIILNSFGSMEIATKEVHKWINITLDIQDIYNDYFNWRISNMPQFASSIGINEYNHLLNDLSKEAFAARSRKCEEFLKRVNAIEPVLSKTSDIRNIKVLKYELETFIGNYDLKGFYLIMNTLGGPQNYPKTDFKWMPRSTFEDYEVMIRRLEKLPEQIYQMIELLDAGVQNNITYHEISMKNLDAVIGKFVVDDPKISPFYFLFEDFPNNVTKEQILDLQTRSQYVIKNHVTPAYRKLLDYITRDYVPRKDIAVTTIKRGKEFYRKLILFHTSTNFTPEEIHNIGLKEVDRIAGEMKKIVLELGFPNMTTQEFSNMIRDDPNNYHNSSKDLVSGFEHIIHNQISPRLSEVFNTIPRAKIEVEADMNPDGVGAYYISGTFDGSRPGVFKFNAFHTNSRPKYGMLTLALHEANPGHHFQHSLTIESPSNPNFRKVSDWSHFGTCPSHFPVYNSFMEGWALYSETLGFDMKLFEDNLERYGHYSAEIFRACRLVVDTGIHALGWTREEAVEYMLNHTASPRIKLEKEVDRYITWPGQALGYKLGEITIRKLRTMAEKELGSSFNLKDFHDVVLNSLGPLEVVKEEVRSWISEIKEY